MAEWSLTVSVGSQPRDKFPFAGEAPTQPGDSTFSQGMAHALRSGWLCVHA
jgi:hypothetical protein